MKDEYILFLFILSFIAIIIFAFSFTNNDFDSKAVAYEALTGEEAIVNNDCIDSLSCENACYDFYGENVEDHLLECRYKCLTLMTCSEVYK